MYILFQILWKSLKKQALILLNLVHTTSTEEEPCGPTKLDVKSKSRWTKSIDQS